MIKKVALYISLAVAMISFSIPAIADSGPNLFSPQEITMTGVGSADDPYRITSCVELQQVNQSLTSSYVLMNDIDCSDTVNWNSGAGFQPIGQYFEGEYFDGRNHTISNLYMNRDATTDYIGLFAQLGYYQNTNTTLKNLRIENADFTNTRIETSNDGNSDENGILASRIYGVVDNVHVNGTLTTSDDGGMIAGYLAGTESIITRSTASGTINGSDSFWNSLGGLIGGSGFSSQGIFDSYSTVNIISSQTDTSYQQMCGGITGSYGPISRSYSSGTISCAHPWDGYTYVGGLAGRLTSATGISNNFSVSEVIPKNFYATGGLVGREKVEYPTNYYDATRTNQDHCSGVHIGGTNEETCTAVNVSGSEPDYFKNNSTNAPLDTWDFTNTWETTTGYPELRPVPVSPDFPTNLSATSQTSSSVILRWFAPEDDGGASITDYIAQYKPSSSGTWQNYSDSVSTSLSMTVSGLSLATNYDFRVRAVNSAGNGLLSTDVTQMGSDLPAVTIDQKAGQSDPTNTVPAVFTVVFNEAMETNSFTIEDITLSGSAAGKQVTSISEVAPNDGTTFEVSASASAEGTIIADIPAATTEGIFNSLCDGNLE